VTINLKCSLICKHMYKFRKHCRRLFEDIFVMKENLRKRDAVIELEKLKVQKLNCLLCIPNNKKCLPCIYHSLITNYVRYEWTLAQWQRIFGNILLVWKTKRRKSWWGCEIIPWYIWKRNKTIFRIKCLNICLLVWLKFFNFVLLCGPTKQIL